MAPSKRLFNRLLSPRRTLGILNRQKVEPRLIQGAKYHNERGDLLLTGKAGCESRFMAYIGDKQPLSLAG